MLTDIPSGTRTVLHVEDNPSNLRLVELILTQRPGTRVVSVKEGTLALELARRHQPQLVLLDVRMPDVGGDEVLRQLRTDPRTRDIPVVMISADATPATIEYFLSAGAVGYLTKPFDIHQLLRIIDSTATPTDVDDGAGPLGDEDNPLDQSVVSRLHELYGPSPSYVLTDLMTRFLHDVRERVHHLRDAAANDEAASVERLAHDLRGSTGLYGARRLPELFGRLESLATSGELTDASRLLRTIEHELHRLYAAIEIEFFTPP